MPMGFLARNLRNGDRVRVASHSAGLFDGMVLDANPDVMPRHAVVHIIGATGDRLQVNPASNPSVLTIHESQILSHTRSN